MKPLVHVQRIATNAYTYRISTHGDQASDDSATFDSLERRFGSAGFRGCPFVNAVAELGAEDRAVRKIAVAFKESRRVWFRDLLTQLGVDDPDGIATQLALLVDGSIAQNLVRDDPSMARAAKAAARILLANAGITDNLSAEPDKPPHRARTRTASPARPAKSKSRQ